jgi:transcriptional regulator of acetoin/glycerol metabolism
MRVLKRSTGRESGFRISARLLSQGRNAWEQYFENEIHNERLMRSSVAGSWQRRRPLKVDPITLAGVNEAEERRLEQCRFKIEHWTCVAQPFLPRATQGRSANAMKGRG